LLKKYFEGREENQEKGIINKKKQCHGNLFIDKMPQNFTVRATNFLNIDRINK